MTQTPAEDAELLATRIHVPDHVVIREFPEESVALNLQTGKYFGLNSVAARMFERLGETGNAGETVDSLAEEYGQDRDVIERDLAALLRELLQRGLVEEGSAGPGN